MVILNIYVLAALIQRIAAIPMDPWTDFKVKFGKSYPTRQEDEERHKIWEKTRLEILPFNIQFSRNQTQPFRLDLNHLADLTEEELNTLKGTIPPPKQPEADSVPIVQNTRRLPSSVDYRDSPCMPPIRDQGRCGSCYAFAAVETIEYYNCMKNGGRLATFSQQNIVDCSRNDRQCLGGFYTNSWDYVKSSGGLCSESDYTYTSGSSGTSGGCRSSTCQPAVTTSSYKNVPNSEDSMAHVVATIGPIAVAMDANLNSFYFYSQGIFNDQRCSSNVNHAVIIVGYGTDRMYGDYWIVRNTWSTSWGERGYFRLQRGKNLCGIANYPYYPIL
ncbi:uncharacterized protein LOC136027233 [Artemia franciscana]|uniref:Uncharacterized protein n=1 Tax=Artemia franciscana TaxID=6661 RepID=A0AA88L0T6_ARTSF|nr:hypothetical protein QYM36_012985 [Artemia franciscana]